MPNLLAMSFEGELAPAFELHCLEPGRTPPDGWGLACYPGGEPAALLLKEAAPSQATIRSSLVAAWERLASNIFLVHIRTAKWGALTEANTQPFVRPWGRRDWVIAHSGSLEHKLVLSGRFEPVGSTDTEQVLCEILTRAAQNEWKSLGDIPPETLHAWLAELNGHGALTLALTDGHDLAVYADANGRGQAFVREILPPHGQLAFGDQDLTVDLTRRGIHARKGLVICSEALAEKQSAPAGGPSEWRRLLPGHLLLCRQGAVRAEIGAPATQPALVPPAIAANPAPIAQQQVAPSPLGGAPGPAAGAPEAGADTPGAIGADPLPTQPGASNANVSSHSDPGAPPAALSPDGPGSTLPGENVSTPSLSGSGDAPAAAAANPPAGPALPLEATQIAPATPAQAPSEPAPPAPAPFAPAPSAPASPAPFVPAPFAPRARPIVSLTRAEIRRYQVLHRTSYRYAQAVERSMHLLRLFPAHDRLQRVLDCEVTCSVPAEQRDFEDVFGNRARRLLVSTAFTEMTIEAKSEVELLDVEPLDLRPARVRSTLPLAWMPWQRQILQPFLLPPELPESELDELNDYANSFAVRNDGELLDTLLDINATIFSEYRYQQGATTLATSAFDVYSQRRGVCQDFTNLFICLARLLGVPARYVCGYLYTNKDDAPEKQRMADASHAWVQVYLPEVGWKGFDPTNGVLTQTGHVRVAVGRNYKDATPTSGALYLGGGGETLSVEVGMSRLA